MNSETIKNFLTESWYLVAILAAAFVAAIYGFVTYEEEVLPEADSVTQADQLPEGLKLADAERILKQQRELPKPTREEAARQVADEHMQKVAADPESEDSPAYFYAAASKIMNEAGDYEEAARLYEMLLERYPYWKNARAVYPKLAQCYKLLGDKERSRGVWRRVLNRYPEGTSEHEVATFELQKGLDEL